jgi:hypothetical protein
MTKDYIRIILTAIIRESTPDQPVHPTHPTALFFLISGLGIMLQLEQFCLRVTVLQTSLEPIPSSLSHMAPNRAAVNAETGIEGLIMKFRRIIALLLLLVCFSPTGTCASPPASLVTALYKQVVARKPIGIPKGSDRAAIWPFLSETLIRKLEAAQSCQDDYFRQHAGDQGKPAFEWLETGLFSGANEKAIPDEAVVERAEPRKDGSFDVYVRLTYKESFETYGKTPDPANTFHWNVVAVVISERGQFFVDDVLFLDENSLKIRARLADSFPGCQGSRWVGERK